MNRLNELANELTVVRGSLGNIQRDWSAEAMKVIERAETILRSAAKADAGMTKWHLVVGDARTSRHNAEVNSARVRIAAVEAERDEHLEARRQLRQERDALLQERDELRRIVPALYVAACPNLASDGTLEGMRGNVYSHVQRIEAERDAALNNLNIARMAVQGNGAERDAALASLAEARRDLEDLASKMVYNGNSVSHWADKAKACGEGALRLSNELSAKQRAIDEASEALDKNLRELVDKQVAIDAACAWLDDPTQGNPCEELRAILRPHATPAATAATPATAASPAHTEPVAMNAKPACCIDCDPVFRNAYGMDEKPADDTRELVARLAEWCRKGSVQELEAIIAAARKGAADA